MWCIPRTHLVALGLAFLTGARGEGDGPVGTVEVRVDLNAQGELDLAALVAALAERTSEPLDPPRPVAMPATGLAGAMTRSLLVESLGPGAAVSVVEGSLVVAIPPEALEPEGRAAWSARLRGLAARAGREAMRRSRYGFRALDSYRPGDPARPTVCLIHGLNSTSGSFVHMAPLLERAGFGVVLYDFPDNQDLDLTVPEFEARWAEFRRARGDGRPWALVTHSMGGLIARAYVEGESYAGDVSDLILIGPPNQGAAVARLQSVIRLVEGTRALRGREAGALAAVGEGLGASADDMRPGSAFLRALNARPRREGVRYRILAGDAGFLPAESRREIESRLGLATRAGGALGRFALLAVGDVGASLDELSEGTGDGCVAVASTRLDGAPEPVVIPANHVELIRGPLLYPDPGPVACMPFVLRWLERPRPPGR